MTLREKIRDKKYRLTLRIWLNVIILLVFIYLALFRYQIQDGLEWARFFKSDLFEYGLITVYCQVIYYVLSKKRVTTIAFWLFLMLVSLVIMAVYKNQYQIDNYGFEFELFDGVLDDLMQYLGYGTLIYLIFLLIDNIHVLLDNDYTKTKRALKDAEMQLMRQQFNPHFLYNAFNSLYSMSIQKSEETPETILKLSAMMRYLTDDVSVSKVPLERELEFILKYVDMERIRFGKDANIKYNIEGETHGKFIEPLLLITLVENAFKHGFYTNNPGAFVYIFGEIIDNNLLFIVENSILEKQHFQEKNRKGKGLDILEKRLKLSYPKQSSLNIEKSDKMYQVTLTLKLN